MKLSRTLLVVLLGLGLQPRPAHAAANKEHLQLMAEIRMLQEQNQQLQALLGTLQDTLKTVTTKIDEQSAATRKAMADQTLGGQQHRRQRARRYVRKRTRPTCAS